MIKSCKKPPVYFESTTGSFYSQYAGLPLKSCRVDLPVNQSGSGTPSPVNERPFVGYNKLTFGNIGDSEIKNYLTGVINGTYGFVDLGTLNWIYSSFQTNHYFHANKPNDCKDKDDDVGLTNCCNSKNYVIASSTAIMNNTVDKAISVGGWGNNTDWIYIADSDYTDAATFKAAMSSVYLIYELETPTASSYTKEQFDALCNSFDVSGISATFNFGQTVYSGSLNILTGVLTVTHGVTVYDGSNDENWAVQSIAGFWIDNTAKKVGRGNYLADNYQATDLSGWDISTPNGYFSGHPTLQRFYFRTPYDSFEVTLDNWRSWLSSNPITVVYELATPITIPLGGMEINTILGLNSLSSSVGNISAEYLKAGR